MECKEGTTPAHPPSAPALPVVFQSHYTTQVERTRDALTQEVTTLGKKTALLQGSLRAARALQAEAIELARKNDVLLELLGEKTEELEAVQGEIADLKAHFRQQLDELLTKQPQGQQH